MPKLSRRVISVFVYIQGGESFYHRKAGELQEELFGAGVLELDSSLLILTCPLQFEDLSHTKPLVFDDGTLLEGGRVRGER